MTDCLNFDCGSGGAREIYASEQFSKGDRTALVTISELIGTYCDHCGKRTYVHDWQEKVLAVVGPTSRPISDVIALEKPCRVYVVAWAASPVSASPAENTGFRCMFEQIVAVDLFRVTAADQQDRPGSFMTTLSHVDVPGQLARGGKHEITQWLLPLKDAFLGREQNPLVNLRVIQSVEKKP
jgi:hypothetical protein